MALTREASSDLTCCFLNIFFFQGNTGEKGKKGEPGTAGEPVSILLEIRKNRYMRNI